MKSRDASVKMTFAIQLDNNGNSLLFFFCLSLKSVLFVSGVHSQGKHLPIGVSLYISDDL